MIKESKIEEAAKVNCIDLSYAGGVKGMEIIWKILDKCVKLVKIGGVLYLFVIKDNEIDLIIEKMKENLFKWEVLAKHVIYNEV